MKAVVTAGAPIDGEFAALAGTDRKGLAPVRGRTMLDLAIDALRGLGVARIAVVGDERIAAAIGDRVERIVADAGSGARNVLAALEAWPEDGEPLLYLTCDMPYVTAGALRDFIERIAPQTLAMPLCEHADFLRRFPGAPPFGITLGGERVINGGAFHIPAGASARIRGFATQLFDARKTPWRMASIAGPALLLRFALGRITIPQLERRARSVLSMPVEAVRGCAPELAFDADVAVEYSYATDHE